MTPFLLGLLALLVLMLLRMPAAFALGLVGYFGFAHYMGFAVASKMTVSALYEVGAYTLSVIPLFVLMGNLVASSGLAKDLFGAAYAFIGHVRGGLAVSTIFACGGFAAISGSSLASAATMTKVALPPMRSFGYSEHLATATIAAGGTLGILIPPSVVFIVYGILTEQSIAKLFAAGVLPGILAVACYLGAVGWVVRRRPDAGPAGERASWSERLTRLRRVGSVLLLFVVVMGGMYGGVFTPTEAAGIGAFGAFTISCWKRSMSLARLEKALVDTVYTSGAIFAILIGATVLSNFINMTGAPELFAEAVRAMELGPIWILLGVIVLYIILGCFFETLSVLLITLPVFLPLILGAGIDLIWFGVLVVVTVELGLITPPFGMNVFVMASSARGIDTGVVFRGLIPFICADLVRLGLLIAFPIISLYLPGLMR